MTPDLFRKLAALGLTNDQMAGVLEVIEAEAEGRKSKARARWHKWKANQPDTNVSKRLQTSANVSQQLARAEEFPSKEEITEKGRKKEPSRRGSPIPDDFVPDIDAAVADGLSRRDAELQAKSFCDFWRSKPGKDGLKLDWPATWRVWYRRNLTPQRSTSPPAPRNAGELARMQLNGTAPHEPPSQDTGRLDLGDGRRQTDGPGIARRFAIPANQFGRI